MKNNHGGGMLKYNCSTNQNTALRRYQQTKAEQDQRYRGAYKEAKEPVANRRRMHLKRCTKH